jgi:hypothetical protein
MKKWQLNTYFVKIMAQKSEDKPVHGSSPDPTLVWTRKRKDTGKTDWDGLQEFAAQGWELVSVTSIANPGESGCTFGLLYTFKKPLEPRAGNG